MRSTHTPSLILDLMTVAGHTNRTRFRVQIIKPLIESGLIEMTIPDKPNSSKQKYRISDLGRKVLLKMEKEKE